MPHHLAYALAQAAVVIDQGDADVAEGSDRELARPFFDRDGTGCDTLEQIENRGFVHTRTSG